MQGMKLMTKELAKSLPPLYGTEDVPLSQKVVQVKFFCPWSQWTWYAVEYDPNDQIFWGLVIGLEREWGYFSLEELESVKGPGGLSIERDRFFQPQPVKAMVESERLDPKLLCLGY